MSYVGAFNGAYPTKYNGALGIDAEASVCRQVPTFNGTDQWVSLTPTIISADYTSEATIVFDGTQTIRPWGTTTNFNSRLLVNVDGSISWRPGNSTSSYDLGAGTITTGIHTIRVERVGSVGELFLNNISQGTQAVTSAGASVNAIQNQQGSFGGGAVYDVDIAGLAIYPLDDGFTNDPTARNTEGNDGTFINMDVNAWSEVCTNTEFTFQDGGNYTFQDGTEYDFN